MARMNTSDCIPFSKLKPGDRVIFRQYKPANALYRQKLMAMGLTPGVEIDVIRKAPMGDPVEICVRGTHIVLRKHEADILCLEKGSCE